MNSRINISQGLSFDHALWLARVTAGVLCAFTGIIHLLYAPTHFAARTDEGLFFLILGVNQIAAGSLLIWGTPSIFISGATLLGTIGVIIMYVASRTTGLPFGPNPGVAEEVGLLDLVATLLEAMTVAFLAVVVATELVRGEQPTLTRSKMEAGERT